VDEDRLSAQTVARRTLSSSFFQIGAQAITLVTGLARSVILARLLVPEDFGLVALALIFANLVWNTTALGIDSRLVQRRWLEPTGLSTHLALRISLASLALLILVLVTPLLRSFYPDRTGLASAVLAYGGLNLLKSFNLTPFVLLKRQLAFRRLAVIGVLSSLAMLIVAPSLALAGWGFWSLIIGEDVTGTLVSTLGLWVWRRPTRFSLKFDREMARDLVGFGKFVMLTHQLNFALDRFDDFWAGTALGAVALGYYSKAYEFATYPRKIISRPLQDVFFSTYARLQHDRLRLSKAFFRANGYVVRAGFLFSPVLVLVAPEFVGIVLGEKWLPMVFTFQLMVVYCLFDPLLVTAGNLLTACGAPQKMTGIRIAQLLFFVPAVIAGAALWQINGIALAADGMLVLGLLVVFRLVRAYVDISVRKLFGVPLLGLAAGAAAVLAVSTFVQYPASLLGAGIKALVFATPYVAILLLLEWPDYREILVAANRLLGLSRLIRWSGLR
jgi:O-antigen/teichoic acid export membrane protein